MDVTESNERVFTKPRGCKSCLLRIFYFGKRAVTLKLLEEKPLLHTWSLAVEEQYYVLFHILVLAWRFGKNRGVLDDCCDGRNKCGFE